MFIVICSFYVQSLVSVFQLLTIYKCIILLTRLLSNTSFTHEHAGLLGGASAPCQWPCRALLGLDGTSHGGVTSDEVQFIRSQKTVCHHGAHWFGVQAAAQTEAAGVHHTLQSCEIHTT